MDKDGTEDGYDLELTRTISETVNVPVIASGGAGKPEHFLEAFVEGKADAALAASVFHYNKYPVPVVKEYLRRHGGDHQKMTEEDLLKKLDFKKGNGLIPVVVQDAKTKKLLMLAYTNEEALEKTLSTGFAHYWSRSRKKLWMKGETSGHTQKIKNIWVDCDYDTLLFLVAQKGNACHTGKDTCFYNKLGRQL